MSATLETINMTLCGKIFSLLMILTLLLKDQPNDTFLLQSVSAVNDINQHYITKCAGILTEYGTTGGLTQAATKRRRVLYNNFIKAFHSNNSIGTMDRIFSKLEKKYLSNQLSTLSPISKTPTSKTSTSKPPTSKTSTSKPFIKTSTFNKSTNKSPAGGVCDMQMYIEQFKAAIIDEHYDDGPENICLDCKSPCKIDEKTSEYVCSQPKCGLSTRIYGEVFDDDQIFYQEGGRGKPVKYEPIKHCKEWVDRIQAKESTEIPDEVLSKIKRCIRRDSIFLENLTYEMIRKYLKELKITSYNNHIALIHKLITGVNPIQFTERELKLIFMYFSKAIQIFNGIKSKFKSNYPYYPFFIYKIIEHILSAPRFAQRKGQILSCIHLLGYETLINKDQVWFMIIEQIPEFKAVPTRAGAYKV
jgi:hypothetical protein